MIVRPYKYLVVAVLQELDDDGHVIGERATEQNVIYGSDALATWAEDFDTSLAAMQTAEQQEEVG
jgi:N6-adenosine-specific RNA methylase IME4